MPTLHRPLGDNGPEVHLARAPTHRTTSASTTATSQRDYLHNLPACLAHVRQDASQVLVTADIHTSDPGSEGGVAPNEDSPIDDHTKEGIDSLLEEIVRGNNHTADKCGEIAYVKERILAIEAAIQKL